MRFFSRFTRGRAEAVTPSTTQDDDPLVIVPIPPLVALLVHYENQKGSPLSEAEVLEIRGKAICMTMRRSHASALAQSRGYDDIDPEVWEQWNAIRSTIDLPLNPLP